MEHQLKGNQPTKKEMNENGKEKRLKQNKPTIDENVKRLTDKTYFKKQEVKQK